MTATGERRHSALYSHSSGRFPELIHWRLEALRDNSLHIAPDFCIHYTLLQSIQRSSLLQSPSQPPKPPHPHPPSFPAIQLRPNIQKEIQPSGPPTAPLTLPPSIEINHIFHLLALPSPAPLIHRTPLDNPIMPIERPLIPPPAQPPRPRTQLPTIATETPQPRPSTRLILPARVSELPVFDEGPGALVDGVMDGNDGGHVGGVGGVVFASEGVEEHSLRGIDPVAFGGGGGGGGL